MTARIDDARLLAVALAGRMAGWSAHEGHRRLTEAGVGIGRSRVYRAWDVARWLSRDLDPRRHTAAGWEATARSRIQSAVRYAR